MEIAPFTFNREEWAIPEKMCRNVPVFTSDSGKRVSGGVIRARAGPGLVCESVVSVTRLPPTVSDKSSDLEEKNAEGQMTRSRR